MLWLTTTMNRGLMDGRIRYETVKYEVVRVEIELNSHDGKRFVKGCTFRFAGEKGELN
jgi:hypothetical protein